MSLHPRSPLANILFGISVGNSDNVEYDKMTSTACSLSSVNVNVWRIRNFLSRSPEIECMTGFSQKARTLKPPLGHLQPTTTPRRQIV